MRSSLKTDILALSSLVLENVGLHLAIIVVSAVMSNALTAVFFTPFYPIMWGFWALFVYIKNLIRLK
jgi:hypothetical protein